MSVSGKSGSITVQWTPEVCTANPNIEAQNKGDKASTLGWKQQKLRKSTELACDVGLVFFSQVKEKLEKASHYVGAEDRLTSSFLTKAFRRQRPLCPLSPHKMRMMKKTERHGPNTQGYSGLRQVRSALLLLRSKFPISFYLKALLKWRFEWNSNTVKTQFWLLKSDFLKRTRRLPVLKTSRCRKLKPLENLRDSCLVSAIMIPKVVRKDPQALEHECVLLRQQ